MKIIITKTPSDHDSDDVRFDVEGKIKGYGFIGRESKKLYLIRCPECGVENYMPMVSSGICAWCGFDANKIK